MSAYSRNMTRQLEERRMERPVLLKWPNTGTGSTEYLFFSFCINIQIFVSKQWDIQGQITFLVQLRMWCLVMPCFNLWSVSLKVVLWPNDTNKDNL